ncbi:MAG: hypothetical protein KAJ19_03075 [Gammaproteobacteria bacterium]|nr:hypothetical protein [Gammaproteobacteria bacterium]
MLSQILYQAQIFERKHGRAPNVVYLNPDHLAYLKQEYPNLFNDGAPIPFGMRIVVKSAEALTHPHVARVLIQPVKTPVKSIHAAAKVSMRQVAVWQKARRHGCI